MPFYYHPANNERFFVALGIDSMVKGIVIISISEI